MWENVPNICDPLAGHNFESNMSSPKEFSLFLASSFPLCGQLLTRHELRGLSSGTPPQHAACFSLPYSLPIGKHFILIPTLFFSSEMSYRKHTKLKASSAGLNIHIVSSRFASKFTDIRTLCYGNNNWSGMPECRTTELNSNILKCKE